MIRFSCKTKVRRALLALHINFLTTNHAMASKIIANIKRWFAFITVVILDEIVKFLYIPEIILNTNEDEKES